MSNIKKIAALVVLVILFIIGVKLAQPVVSELLADKTPIVEITAKNKKKYDVNSKINKTDFEVTAIHEDGKREKLGSEEFEVSRTEIDPIGEQTQVTISLKNDKNTSCDVAIDIKREELMRFACGYPEEQNVYAVLYSNGELCFEGEGDVVVYEEGNYPWNNYEKMDDMPITSVSFQEGVKPTNMNYWFEGCETLTYIAPIPNSVKTMVRAFGDCSLLANAADWSSCAELLNITEAYSNCTSLVNTSKIPSAVSTAIGTYQGCTELAATPEMTDAIALTDATSMFQMCSKLNEAALPPKLLVADSMFADCINLKEMPTISKTVQSMDSTFANDISLATMKAIPRSVINLDECFRGCESLEGSITIHANAASFQSMFEGAALATNVNLKGHSKLLDAYANTSDQDNITVQGKAPKYSID